MLAICKSDSSLLSDCLTVCCPRFEAHKNDYTGYNVWGAGISEVEVDILTGQMMTVRTDLLEDAGLSTSPLVDIGQVEGAFIMGLGLFTSEEIKHDSTTGELLTKNTWEYKPPAAKDIPQDFRVTLLKNARNPMGVMSSKGNRESLICISFLKSDCCVQPPESPAS